MNPPQGVLADEDLERHGAGYAPTSFRPTPGIYRIRHPGSNAFASDGLFSGI
jgi:hypothetical protein